MFLFRLPPCRLTALKHARRYAALSHEDSPSRLLGKEHDRLLRVVQKRVEDRARLQSEVRGAYRHSHHSLTQGAALGRNVLPGGYCASAKVEGIGTPCRSLEPVDQGFKGAHFRSVLPTL